MRRLLSIIKEKLRPELIALMSNAEMSTRKLRKATELYNGTVTDDMLHDAVDRYLGRYFALAGQRRIYSKVEDYYGRSLASLDTAPKFVLYIFLILFSKNFIESEGDLRKLQFKNSMEIIERLGFMDFFELLMKVFENSNPGVLPQKNDLRTKRSHLRRELICFLKDYRAVYESIWCHSAEVETALIIWPIRPPTALQIVENDIIKLPVGERLDICGAKDSREFYKVFKQSCPKAFMVYEEYQFESNSVDNDECFKYFIVSCKNIWKWDDVQYLLLFDRFSVGGLSRSYRSGCSPLDVLMEELRKISKLERDRTLAESSVHEFYMNICIGYSQDTGKILAKHLASLRCDYAYEGVCGYLKALCLNAWDERLKCLTKKYQLKKLLESIPVSEKNYLLFFSTEDEFHWHLLYAFGNCKIAHFIFNEYKLYLNYELKKSQASNEAIVADFRRLCFDVWCSDEVVNTKKSLLYDHAHDAGDVNEEEADDFFDVSELYSTDVSLFRVYEDFASQQLPKLRKALYKIPSDEVALLARSVDEDDFFKQLYFHCKNALSVFKGIKKEHRLTDKQAISRFRKIFNDTTAPIVNRGFMIALYNDNVVMKI